MSSELEKALEKAKYSALPLPRAKSEPTTIFSFSDGHLFIVRNAHSCLPNPPLGVTPDPSVDTLTFAREFKFELKTAFSFLLKVFGAGSANAELEARDVHSATVVLGGLSHHTIETGELMDYLLKQDRKSACLRDILNNSNLVIVAALQASTFTYTFKNEKGATVKFSGPEANGMFKAEASVDVRVTEEGKIVVNSPCFIGVVTWSGERIAQELEKARRFALGMGLRKFSPGGVFELAMKPGEIRARQVASLAIAAPRKKPR
jgi:hypothetical protein